MARMIELIRESKVPSNVMRAAAHGALTLPSAEMIEILVYLTRNPVFAEHATMTLAGWDIVSSIKAAADPHTPREVLDYMIAPKNRRPRLLPALLENPSVPEEKLVDMAQTASREVVDMMLKSMRVRRSDRILHALATNVHLDAAETADIRLALRDLGEDTQDIGDVLETGDTEHTQFEIEHAAEIAAEEGKKFELVGGIEALEADLATTRAADSPPPAAPSIESAAPAPAAVPVAVAVKPAPKPGEPDHRSALQKIQQMSVAQRIQLAFKGNKEERFILIRDGCKLVSQAVLESPKVNEQEIETFAGMKNVQESVLRTITMKRQFMKNYAVVRALVNNPRCPLDLSLTLMNHLLVNDLRNLSMNKNVPETLRKLALKSYKQKSTPAGKKPE